MLYASEYGIQLTHCCISGIECKWDDQARSGSICQDIVAGLLIRSH